MLALMLQKSSTKGVATTAGDVLDVLLDDAVEEAREYARGWMKDRARSVRTLPQLDLYAAVVFRPLQ